MLNKRISSQIVQAALRNLVANTDISFFGSGSISRTLIESMAREIELLYDNIDLNLSQSKLSTASGAFLDIIASQFGLVRLGSVTGSILAEDKAVRFYVRSGRLIDHLSGSTPTTGVIPGGTTIQNRDGTIVYKVTADAVFPANARSVFVPVTPSDSSLGARNNVPAGALVTHSLTSTNILVENTLGLVTSRDPESDGELRLRISRHINSRVSGSRAAVLQAAFAFPGVSDIRINPFKHGAGSFELLIVPTGSRVSPNILASIRAAVDSVVPFGIKVSARGPGILSVALIVQIDMGSGQLREAKAGAASVVQAALREYIGSVPMGGQLVMNRIRSLVLQSHPGIRDLSILQFTVDCKPQVIANYQLRPDEVFDLDREVPTPLLVI